MYKSNKRTIDFNLNTNAFKVNIYDMSIYINRNYEAYFRANELYFIKKMPRMVIFLIILLCNNNNMHQGIENLYHFLSGKNYKKICQE